MKHEKQVMYPAAGHVIRLGILLSVVVLLLGFLAQRGSFLAISVCRAAVMMFAVSVVGGLILDVAALKKGMRE